MKLACGISFGIYFLNSLYKNLGLLYALVFAGETPLYQLVAHMIIASGGVLISLWYYILFVQYPGVYATFARMTLTASITRCRKC